MLQVKVTVKSIAAGKPCTKFKVGDSWIVDWGKVIPGMCGHIAVDVAFIIEAMMGAPGIPVWKISCPSCLNTDSIMIYEIENLHPGKPFSPPLPPGAKLPPPPEGGPPP